MGAMTREQFNVEMRRLRDLPFPPSSLDGHWDALYDVPLVLLRAAVTHALRTRTRFPTGAELRADVDHVVRMLPIEPDDRVREVPLPEPVSFTLPTGKRLTADREYTYDCDICRDSGWADRECHPEHGSSCGRPSLHDAHPFVVPCLCIPTNRTIQHRKAAAGVRYAQTPEKVGA